MAYNNTVVKLYKNTGLTSQHKRYFDSPGARDGFMSGFLTDTISGTTYQRAEGKTWFSSPRVYEQVWDTEYISFKNNDFGGVEQYGRVTSCEYRNPGDCRIHFVLDSYLTFFPYTTVTGAFVQREHIENDWNGGIPGYRNTEAEPITCVDHKSLLLAGRNFNSWKIVVLSTVDMNDPVGVTIPGSGLPSAVPARQTKVGNLSLGCGAYIFDIDSATLSSQLKVINENGLSQHILGAYCVPSELVTTTYSPINHTILGTLNASPEFGSIGGYSPQNSKCFNYPYSYIEATNNTGTTVVYKHENFASPQTCVFEIAGLGTNDGCMYLVPLNYNGKSKAYDMAVNSEGFPDSPLNIDGLAGYQQRAYDLMVKGWLTLGELGVATATGNAVAGAGALVKGVTTQVSGHYNLERENAMAIPIMKGAPLGRSIMSALQGIGFQIYQSVMLASHAETVDKFFDANGYNVNRAKKPNLNTRPSWNYVKCGSIDLKTPAPQPYKTELESMFLSGVTFWQVDTLGDYSLNNRG